MKKYMCLLFFFTGLTAAQERSMSEEDCSSLESSSSEEPSVNDEFLKACSQGSLEDMEQFLTEGASLESVSQYIGTALHHALESRSIDVLKKVVDLGVNIDKPNKQGATPLYESAGHQNSQFLKFLISKGADLNKVVRGGHTALHLASSLGRIDHMKLLLDAGARHDTQTAANYEKRVAERAQQMKESHWKQPRITPKSVGLKTPLHAAAMNSKTGSGVELLVKAKADIKALDEYGNTPLHYAARYGSVTSIKLLLAAGAEVDIQNRDGETPLHYAVYGYTRAPTTPFDDSSGIVSQDEIVVSLLGKSNDLNRENKFGETVLMLAVEDDLVALVKTLLDAGATVHQRDNEGVNALGIALRRGDPEVIELLLGSLLYRPTIDQMRTARARVKAILMSFLVLHKRVSDSKKEKACFLTSPYFYAILLLSTQELREHMVHILIEELYKKSSCVTSSPILIATRPFLVSYIYRIVKQEVASYEKTSTDDDCFDRNEILALVKKKAQSCIEKSLKYHLSLCTL